MPKARRKVPVTAEQRTSSSPSSSAGRATIRRFHVLLKRQAQLRAHNSGNAAALAEIEREIESLGGLEAYQRMSTAGQSDERGGGSEKFFISWLKELQIGCTKPSSTKLSLLEVGALLPDNYASCSSWISVTPIDLNSRHPAIKQQDFLQMDVLEHASKWDLISLSLVLNFVPNAHDRGRMLCLAHAMLRPNGHLFVALPLPCVQNSRYLTVEHFHALMSAVGFNCVKERWKVGGRMGYWLYHKIEGQRLQQAEATQFTKKAELRAGSSRNNFSILL